MYFLRSLTVSIILFSSASFSLVMAQCPGGTQNGTLDPITSTFQFFTSGTGGEYQTFTAVFGEQYEFSYCPTEGGASTYDTEISVNDAFATNYAYDDDFCGGQSHLFWTATASGTFQLLTTEFSCQSNGTTSTLAYRVVITTDVEEKDAIEGLVIGPNPTSGMVTLTGDIVQSDMMEIVITDLMGRQVVNDKEININGHYTASYDLSTLTKGVYMITLKTGEETRTEKIVLQ